MKHRVPTQRDLFTYMTISLRFSWWFFFIYSEQKFFFEGQEVFPLKYNTKTLCYTGQN